MAYKAVYKNIIQNMKHDLLEKRNKTANTLLIYPNQTQDKL